MHKIQSRRFNQHNLMNNLIFRGANNNNTGPSNEELLVSLPTNTGLQGNIYHRNPVEQFSSNYDIV